MGATEWNPDVISAFVLGSIQTRSPAPVRRAPFCEEHIENVGLVKYCSHEKSRTAAAVRGEHKQSEGNRVSCVCGG